MCTCLYADIYGSVSRLIRSLFIALARVLVNIYSVVDDNKIHVSLKWKYIEFCSRLNAAALMFLSHLMFNNGCERNKY